ncbi:MAG: NIPSNAP family protein, partial [Pseudomonadota bacterium]|nr:NIPSNAP family protein [Pseudomonadota bacterium]
QQNYDFAQQEKFILREDRTWLKLASAPHGTSGDAT